MGIRLAKCAGIALESEGGKDGGVKGIRNYISDLLLHGVIGVNTHEQKNHQQILFNLAWEGANPDAHVAIAAMVEDIVTSSSYKLVETLAGEIAKTAISLDVDHVDVTLEK